GSTRAKMSNTTLRTLRYSARGPRCRARTDCKLSVRSPHAASSSAASWRRRSRSAFGLAPAVLPPVRDAPTPAPRRAGTAPTKMAGSVDVRCTHPPFHAGDSWRQADWPTWAPLKAPRGARLKSPDGKTPSRAFTWGEQGIRTPDTQDHNN